MTSIQFFKLIRNQRDRYRRKRQSYWLPWEFINQFQGEEARYYEQMAFSHPHKCGGYGVGYEVVPSDVIHKWLREIWKHNHYSIS